MAPIYITLLLVTLGHFIVDFMIGIWPVHKTMAQLDLATAGIIAGSCAFIGEGAQLYFGGLADRGYRRFLIGAGVLAASASVFLSYADEYAFLAILYLMTCLGSGAFHPSAVSLISRMTVQHKTLFITIFAAGGALGLASSQLIFSHSHAFLNGNTAILAIPALFLVLYIASRSLHEPPVSQTLPPNSKIKAIKEFFKDRNLTLLYISQVCSQTIAWAIIFLLPDVLQTKGYNSWICYGGGHLCFILGGAFMMIPSGYLAEKYSAKSVIFIASLISCGIFYCLLFTPLLSSIAIGALLFTFGAALNVINPISVAFGNRLMPTNPGTVSACLMGMALCVAEVLGPGGGGLLTKLFTEDAPIKALAILGLAFIPGLTAASLLPKTVTDPIPQTPNN